MIDVLLQGALNWPLADEDDENIEIDDISYSWDDVLVEMGFSSADAPIELRQVMPFPNWPHGIFIVRFGSGKFFTQGRGMTTPLRTILRELMDKVRPKADHPSWKKEHLLFLCHSETKYFEFARFENPTGDSKTSKLHMFGWGPNDHIHTLCKYNLTKLIYKPGMNEEEANEAVASAFDMSKVSERFYEDYKKEFGDAKVIIAANTNTTEEDELHKMTQNLFNRILFLRFVEKKGWLQHPSGQTENYLQELFKTGGVGSSTFYTSILKPLFFEGLGMESEKIDAPYGNVPFLNGGLFKATDFEKTIDDLPDEMFIPLLNNDGLFYRYNFTVHESTPLDINVAIDPEMIGTLFEELVTGRRSKGAFYTPKNVVSFMCKEAIVRFLLKKNIGSEEDINTLVFSKDITDEIDMQKTIGYLKGIRIIDPACGSGAYLVGFVHELVDLVYNLQTKEEGGRHSLIRLADLKKHFVSHCIFGVDLEESAVLIARLRLWLTLAVDSVTAEPLPNLELNIVAGNSVSGPNPRRYLWPDDDKLARKIGKLRADCIYKSGEAGEAGMKELGDLMQTLQKKILDEWPRDAIGYGVRFPDVILSEGGFDVVIANPPYIRQEKIDRITKDAAVKRRIYRDVITGKSDLYAYFYARAEQLLKKGGTSCFICSNTWMDVEFGFRLQKHFVENFTDILIIDTRRERQFASAEINTIISIMDKGVAEDDNEIVFMMLEKGFEDSISNIANQTTKSITKGKIIEIGKQGDTVYQGFKWSPILRAPQLYHDILELHKDKLKKISEICTKTQRNNMRILPTGFEVLSENAGDYPTRCPFLHSFKDVSGIRLDLSEQKSVSHEKIGGAMENAKFRRADIVSNRFYGNRIFFIEGGDYFVNDSFFIGIVNNKKFSAKNTILALNSTLSLLFVEIRGRKGQGGGVITFYGPEFTGHQIINPNLLDGIDDSIYESLVTRDIKDVYKECGLEKSLQIREQIPNPLPDRKIVDDYVFDILGLDDDERKEVYWSLCESVLNRETKAKSV